MKPLLLKKPNPRLIEGLRRYFRESLIIHLDLQELIECGMVRSLFPELRATLSKSVSDSGLNVDLFASLNSIKDNPPKGLANSTEFASPELSTGISFHFLLELFVVIAVEYGIATEKLPKREIDSTTVARILYVALSLSISESLASPLITSNDGVYTLLNQYRAAQSPNLHSEYNRLLKRRQQIETALRTKIIQQIPSFDDLPPGELLNVRERCQSEIEQFQVAVSRLATEVSVDLDDAHTHLAIDDVIASHVNPAVADLRRSLRSRFRTILDSTKELAIRVSVVLAFTRSIELSVLSGFVMQFVEKILSPKSDGGEKSDFQLIIKLEQKAS